MNFSEKINKENLHHGYLVIGDRQDLKDSLFDFLENRLQINITQNPDFSFTDFNTLTIEDARNLSLNQTRKDFGSDKKIYVVSTNIITEEAQNALLKVFEEPTVGTHFFILVSQNTFLPTFLSRLVVLKSEGKESEKEESLLSMSVAERLAFITKLTGDISDEKKVKQDAIEFVNKIESELIKDGTVKNASSLKECQFTRNALFSRGAMIKMLLENLILQI